MVLSASNLLLLIVIFMPAVALDIKYHRIPNWLCFSGWVCGLGLGALLGGWEGFLEAGLGLLLLLALTLPFFIFGWMGAGDVKLIGAVGAVVGGGMALNVLLGIVLSGLVMSLAVLAWKGELFNAFSRYFAILGFCIIEKRPVYISPPEAQAQLVLPYAVPIAVGTLVTVIVAYT